MELTSSRFCRSNCLRLWHPCSDVGYCKEHQLHECRSQPHDHTRASPWTLFRGWQDLRHAHRRISNDNVHDSQQTEFWDVFSWRSLCMVRMMRSDRQAGVYLFWLQQADPLFGVSLPSHSFRWQYRVCFLQHYTEYRLRPVLQRNDWRSFRNLHGESGGGVLPSDGHQRVWFGFHLVHARLQTYASPLVLMLSEDRSEGARSVGVLLHAGEWLLPAPRGLVFHGACGTVRALRSVGPARRLCEGPQAFLARFESSHRRILHCSHHGLCEHWRRCQLRLHAHRVGRCRDLLR